LEGDELVQAMGRLTDRYEQYSAKPVSLETMGAEFVAKEMRGLIGFEISITSIEAAYKLSQNRDKTNQMRIIAELEKLADLNAHAIAAEMGKRL